MSQTYYFQGCYTAMKDSVTENQEILVGIAIGVAVTMVQGVPIFKEVTKH